ncbi:hypothetical protein [Bosea sp. (in: a-proteobacteria)]|jgi:hypothetical protein
MWIELETLRLTLPPGFKLSGFPHPDDRRRDAEPKPVGAWRAGKPA